MPKLVCNVCLLGSGADLQKEITARNPFFPARFKFPEGKGISHTLSREATVGNFAVESDNMSRL